MTDRNFLEVEDLIVYQRLCQLHIDVCDLTRTWPPEERFELAGQVRRSSNSSPAQLAEKNDDRHVRNKIEGVNRSRGEAAESIHHLFVAWKKDYITERCFRNFQARYKECIKMLNGLEKNLEQKIPDSYKRWKVKENTESYGITRKLPQTGWPAN